MKACSYVESFRKIIPTNWIHNLERKTYSSTQDPKLLESVLISIRNNIWPSDMIGIVCTDFLSGGNGGALIFKDFSLECAFSEDGSLPNSTKKMILSAMFPFLLGIVFMLFWALLALQQSNARSYVFQHWIVTAYSVFYISYPALAESLLKITMCQNVDRTSDGTNAEFSVAVSKYWMEDMDIRCYSNRHLLLLIVSGVPLILVIFGLPIWYLFVIIRYGGVLNEAEYLRVYGFLYKPYRPENRYWELMIMARRAFLFVIVAYSHSLGSHLQELMAIAVLSVSLWAHLIATPFKGGRKLNIMEAVSLCSSIFVFFLGLVFEDPKTSDALRAVTSIVLIIAVAATMAYLIWSLVREVFKGIDGLLAEWGIEFSDSDPLIRKILLLVMSIPRDFRKHFYGQNSESDRKHPSLSHAVSMESQKAIEEGKSSAFIPSTELPCGGTAKGKDSGFRES